MIYAQEANECDSGEDGDCYECAEECKLNCDFDEDGECDSNCDEDGDGDCDANCDPDGDGECDSNCDDDGDGECDSNCDCNSDCDDDGDGDCDRNCDDDDDGDCDRNCDEDNDGDCDRNCDDDDDGDCDSDCDDDDDGDCDRNCDDDDDGKCDRNCDDNDDGECDRNCDDDDDGKCDRNCDDECGPPNFCIPRVHAVDPNDIIGPLGYDTIQWMSVNDLFGYKIRFENDPVFATAPAQEVRINCPVDPNLNINTVTLGTYGFGDFVFTPPPNTNAYFERIDLTDSLNLVLDVTAGIDIVNKEVFWILSSIDPLTNLPPQDALTGFLPVNDTVSIYNDTIPGRGEGFVNFNIYPKKNLITGDTITVQASIVFDINEAIETNTWLNIIDAFSPTSTMAALPNVSPNQTIPLSWNALDDPGGVGEDKYDLYVSIDSAQFFLHTADINTTFFEFEGDPGRNYQFYIRSKDFVNNLESPKFDADASSNTLGSNDDFPGCTDPTACNFQDFATEDDGTCDFGNSACSDPCNPIFGCTNPQATNYNSSATCEDDSCDFPAEGCTDSGACNYNPGANIDDGTCDFGNSNCSDPCNAVVGCMNELAENYNPDATCGDDSCVFSTLGCTDSAACNYNSFATEDDGSCDTLDCAGICGGNNVAGETCDDEDPNTIMDTYDADCNCAGTPISIFGCTDSTACNYNPSADTDNGNCDFGNLACSDPCNPPNPDDGCNLTIDSVDAETCTIINKPVCPANATFSASTCSCTTEIVPGCTDPCADNYNENANEDDNSCEPYNSDCDEDTCFATYIWDAESCNCLELEVENNCDDEDDCTNDSVDETTCECVNETIEGCPAQSGCTDPCAANYNPAATEDDNSCETYEMTCPENTCTSTFTWNAESCSCIEAVVDFFCDDENECTNDYINEITCECVNEVIASCNKGCTDPCSANYDPTAKEDDGSCVFYDTTCNSDCQLGNTEVWNEELCECTIVEESISGCTDQNACNYNPNANCDDDACSFDCNACNLQDWKALKQLYINTDGDNWKRKDGWEVVKDSIPPADCDLSTLYGVQQNYYRRVSEINLYNNNLNGPLPSEIGDLSELTALYLAAVYLGGEIPKEIGKLNKLKYLFLVSSGITGAIPPEIGQLTSLTDLRLSYNEITGSIPNELTKLANLSYLSLSDNQLTGDIPSELANLSRLGWLSLSNNQLTGSIPAAMGNLTNLRLLTLDHNDLSGCYPTALSNLCDQLIYNFFGEEDDISTGNNFDATWEEFCSSDAGGCNSLRLGDLNNFYLYPNPTNGQVFIQFESSLEQTRSINIYDLTGNRYLTRLLKTSGKIELNTQHFPKGIYIVEVNNGFHSKTQKLIIQ